MTALTPEIQSCVKAGALGRPHAENSYMEQSKGICDHATTTPHPPAPQICPCPLKRSFCSSQNSAIKKGAQMYFELLSLSRIQQVSFSFLWLAAIGRADFRYFMGGWRTTLTYSFIKQFKNRAPNIILLWIFLWWVITSSVVLSKCRIAEELIYFFHSANLVRHGKMGEGELTGSRQCLS